MTAVGTADTAWQVTEARLLVGDRGAWQSDLPTHLRTHGPVPLGGLARGRLVEMVRSAGLTGRGGAGYPSAEKLEFVRRSGRRPLVVVNLMEGEPASFKDRTLAVRAPHLILDGAELAGEAVGAAGIVVCVAREHRKAVRAMDAAIRQRAEQLGRRRLELRTPPGRYVAGEESALTHWLDRGRAQPTFRASRPATLRVARRPVLVHNAETLAHVALIARYGAEWFRAVGTEEAPGTALMTVTGAVAGPGVLEVPLGTPASSLLAVARPTAGVEAVLLGGYGGTWMPARELDTPLSPPELARRGRTLGAGVYVVLPRSGCGLAETARIAQWMASERAGQCGPCAFGLPAVADDLTVLAFGRGSNLVVSRLVERLAMVEGRGACRHPDGVVRLVRTALEVFSDDLDRHLRHGPCPGTRDPSVLTYPVQPEVDGWR